MNQIQQDFYDIVRPIWLYKAKAGKMPAGLAKLRFMVWLQKQLKIEAEAILEIKNMTNEQIRVACDVVLPLVEIVDKDSHNNIEMSG